MRRLTVDQEIAVPVNKVVHVLVTSNDVIHSWTVPSFGVKMQAVPGRTAAVWFKPRRSARSAANAQFYVASSILRCRS